MIRVESNGILGDVFEDEDLYVMGVDATKSPSDQTENLTKQTFDARQWDDALINTMMPVLLKQAGEAAAAQMMLMGVDVTRGRQKLKAASPKSIKTTATDYLAGEAIGDVLESMVFETAVGPISMGFMTEWPVWMKHVIVAQVKEAFEQPYWRAINDTTESGIESFIRRGLVDGKSIWQMSKELREDGLDEYYHGRAKNIARTESGNALNGARKASMDQLAAEVPGLVMRQIWMSVLGTTTRDSHAINDGVPADADGMWMLSGIRVPWPSHFYLPAKERCNCQCSLTYSWGMRDEEAEQLIGEYNARYSEIQKGVKFNPNHGPDGRFSSGSGYGSMAPDTGGAVGGGGGEADVWDWIEQEAESSVASFGGSYIEVSVEGDLKSAAFSMLGTEDVDNVLRVAGAPSGSTANINVSSDDMLLVQWKHEGLGISATRFIEKDNNGKTVVRNDRIDISADKQGGGNGTRILNEQVKTSTSLGVDRIECSAYRDSESNGYYTWPRLGYDAKVGDLGRTLSMDVEKAFPGTKRVSDLMKTKEGRVWWKQHGDTFDASFDLNRGSQSRKVLDAYVKARFEEA